MWVAAVGIVLSLAGRGARRIDAVGMAESRVVTVAPLVDGRLEGLSVPVSFADGKDAATMDEEAGTAADDEETEPVLNSSMDTRRSVATIRIPVYAGGLRHRLRKELYRLMRQEVRVIDVFLDLLTPGTAEVAELLEDLGFLFTGVRPGGRSSEWLLYQLFNGVVVDYDAVQIESEGTQRLLDYIRGNDPRVAGL